MSETEIIYNRIFNNIYWRWRHEIVKKRKMALIIGLILLIPLLNWIFKEDKSNIASKLNSFKDDIAKEDFTIYDDLGISKPYWANYPKIPEDEDPDDSFFVEQFKRECKMLGMPFPAEDESLEGNINISAIREYKGEGIKKFEFRPQNFNQFIGQKEAKERAKTIIKKVNKGFKAHFLIDGIKGHGKNWKTNKRK